MKQIGLPCAALVLLGCQVVGGFEPFEAGASAAAQGPCASLPSVKEDAAHDDVLARVDIPGGTCLWMDLTEVTVEQYQSFVEAAAAHPPSFEPTWCQWKDQISDPAGTPDDACAKSITRYDLQPFGPSKPIRCVDFCDAEAYCRWAGKHLCYDRATLGTQGPSGFPAEWLLGCTNSRTTVYPWGNTLADGECNVGQTAERCLADDPTCGPHVEGGITSCKNARGVLDQLGNVSEWTFSCTFVDSRHPLEPSMCMTRGGGYDDPAQACSLERSQPANSRTPSLGFRCCGDLTAAEQVQLVKP